MLQYIQDKKLIYRLIRILDFKVCLDFEIKKAALVDHLMINDL